MNSPDKKTLVEQHRIVAKVDELVTLCDQLETQPTTQSESRHLIESIFHQIISAARPRI